jgi:hypothetical protein
MNEKIYFIVPGSLAIRTGGYAYDRRIIEHLRAGGWTVEPIELGGNFPNPDDKTRAKAEKIFATIPNQARVVVDGLAFGALPEIAEKEHSRLVLIGLVHHPLADETGIADDLRQELMRSEASLPVAAWCNWESAPKKFSSLSLALRRHRSRGVATEMGGSGLSKCFVRPPTLCERGMRISYLRYRG